MKRERRDCQNGAGDVCAMARFDGVVCPDSSCDIDDGVRRPPAPVRVQLSRAKGWRMPANTIKVDRSTPWGNPFRKCGSAEDVVDAFRRYLENERTADAANLAMAVRHELRGKNLACWCKLSAKCHADVLLDVANA